jgi:hypothetical protein
MDTDDLQEKLGTALIAFHDRIREVCEGLTDAEMSELAKVYEVDSKPNESHTFAMSIYHYIAERIEGERGMRIAFDAAKEYMERTGEGYYCVYCGGACTPEHIAQFQD